MDRLALNLNDPKWGESDYTKQARDADAAEEADEPGFTGSRAPGLHRLPGYRPLKAPAAAVAITFHPELSKNLNNPRTTDP